MGETVKLANRSGDEIDLLGLAAAAGVAAIFAFFLVAGADAPIGALVAIDPGAVADRFALIAGDRQGLGLAVIEIEILAVARPDIVAVLAVELKAHGVGMAVLDGKGDVAGMSGWCKQDGERKRGGKPARWYERHGNPR
ncbi:mll4659 [Mesorhizobium japonicum MAFF 303099]|uniref:Mll4659 protein n=1 Tax=Mesorhizobium japonicum (strain LMG 29417 / CECT 9101 / MAFF 303099) TaxID=266835 RepID=Q98DK8_RHILO|nr:mll4659 [Mesorhizobium japonicum MAFF 303099]